MSFLQLLAGCAGPDEPGRLAVRPFNASSAQALMKWFILGCLALYKRFLSPWIPRACRFEPTCSEYMYQAIKKKGVIKGILLGVWRLLRCHPFSAGGHDPVS